MEPEVFHRDPFWVPANSETAVEVEPVVYFYDNDTRSLSSAQRKCVFNVSNGFPTSKSSPVSIQI